MNWSVALALIPLLALLALASYVDRVYQEIGKFLSREFQDNIDVFEQKVEPILNVSRARASLSMSVLKQSTTAAIALTVGYLVFGDQHWCIYGILEADRDLIQSAVEFSGKTVREAMKPRPEIFAVPVETTVERFIEMLRTKHYSRVPVYSESIHNIKGIVYAQDVLQVPDSEATKRTLDTLMRRDLYFVPESKRGSDLLREMQKNNIRMAIVVDEYGGVAGLVTIEDLVEEIVGEIRDEHEKPEIIREN